MKHKVFSIEKDHAPQDYLTISTKSNIQSENIINYFSLGKNTDISAESYSKHVILIGNGGIGEINIEGQMNTLKKDEIIFILKNTNYGISSKEGFVFSEIILDKEEYNMNELIKAGEVFKLKDLISYQEGSIVNLDVVSNESFKFVIMAFDEGTELSEHAAPGEAIIFALEGKGIIGYEKEEHPISAGENFHFAKGGMHTVKADGKFKMGLLLVLK